MRALFSMPVLAVLSLLAVTPIDADDTARAIQLTPSESSIYVGDSVFIDIEAYGLIEELDVNNLSANADLLRESFGTRISVIEGKVVEIHTRRMEYLPHDIGTTTFGPLTGMTEAGPVESSAAHVRVLPQADTIWHPESRDANISMRLSPMAPHVGQQLTLDIELRHRFPVVDELIEVPTLDAFDVLPIFEERRTIDRTADENTPATAPPTRLVAWRYLLWPRRSGPQGIDALDWSGTLVRSRTRRASIALQSNPIEVNVLPRSDDATGWWLPARNLSLSEQWSRDPRELTAGDDIERILTVQANGVLVNHLPRIEPLATRSISSVAIDERRHQELIGGEVRSTAEFRYRLTARSPVPVFLDTVRVVWWDTDEKRATEAIVPARRVNIGLPDRADLLSNIALEQDAWTRLKIALASAKFSTTAGAVLAVVLALALLLTIILPWPHRLDQRNQRPHRLPPL